MPSSDEDWRGMVLSSRQIWDCRRARSEGMEEEEVEVAEEEEEEEETGSLLRRSSKRVWELRSRGSVGRREEEAARRRCTARRWEVEGERIGSVEGGEGGRQRGIPILLEWRRRLWVCVYVAMWLLFAWDRDSR